MSAAFLRRYSQASASAVQAAARKLMESDLLAIENGTYFIPDILFRMYLLRLKNSNTEYL